MGNGKLLEGVRQLKRKFADSDIMGMRSLGNSLIEEAAVDNNRMLADIALITYSLHKLGSKAHISGHETWLRVKSKVLSSLGKAEKALEQNRDKDFDKIVHISLKMGSKSFKMQS